MLRELAVDPSGCLVVPLLSFNLGVELGQVALAALAVPAIAVLRRRPTWRQRVLLPASWGLGLIGSYWTFERIGAALAA